MRILPALLVIIASSTRAVNGVNAQEVCTAADYADGTCTQPNDQNEYDSSDSNDEYDSEDWSGDDDGEHWSGDDEHYDDHGMECVDEDDKCAAYAEDGACELNPGYMTHYCAASCDTCDAVIAAAKAAEFVDEKDFSEACKDDDYRCAEWAGMGECDANPGMGALVFGMKGMSDKCSG